MRNLVPDLLPRLEAYRLNGLDAGPQSYYPVYDRYSLANVPSSVCHWLGIPAFGAPPLGPEILDLYAPEFQNVILFVVDGMGLNMLQRALDQASSSPDLAVWAEMADQAALAPITSVAPSTTSAALTTFWTGRTPAEHGVVGYEVWLKEYGMIANMIFHNPASFVGDVGSLTRAGFRPESFLPVPTLGPHLIRHGVRPYAFQHQSIARSGLSTMLLSGVEVSPFRSQSDLWVSLTALLDSTKQERKYTYIYLGDLDEHSHHFGPDDARVELEFMAFSRRLGYFIREQQKRGRKDTLMLITADHGHIFTPRNPDYELRNHPALLDCLTMVPSGEARLPFVYLRNNREERFLRYLEETWPGQFLPIPSQQAIQAGLFGPTGHYERLADRVGDYVIIPQGDAYWWFSNRDNPLLGRHGGLGKIEMQSPLFSLVL